MSIDKKNLATVEMMWRREVEAAATYKHLAREAIEAQGHPDAAANQEDKHAARWSERIAATTGRVRSKKWSADCRGSSASPIERRSAPARQERTRPKRNTTS
jgi:hypothetical protein